MSGVLVAAPEQAPTREGHSGVSAPAGGERVVSGDDFCAHGELQSPIDITGAQRTTYVPLMFQYRSQLLEAENIGRGVRLISPPGSALLIRGQAFDLMEFSFKVPGEHHFDGKSTDAEIHLMHRDAKGSHVMVAIPLSVSLRENLILDRILDYLPTEPGQRVRHRQVGINPLFLLPSDRSYYRYAGSLVDPPCTESVLWLVLREPLEVSASQIQRIARVTGTNARPVQPLNGRPVYSMFRN